MTTNAPNSPGESAAAQRRVERIIENCQRLEERAASEGAGEFFVDYAMALVERGALGRLARNSHDRVTADLTAAVGKMNRALECRHRPGAEAATMILSCAVLIGETGSAHYLASIVREGRTPTDPRFLILELLCGLLRKETALVKSVLNDGDAVLEAFPRDADTERLSNTLALLRSAVTGQHEELRSVVNRRAELLSSRSKRRPDRPLERFDVVGLAALVLCDVEAHRFAHQGMPLELVRGEL